MDTPDIPLADRLGPVSGFEVAKRAAELSNNVTDQPDPSTEGK